MEGVPKPRFQKTGENPAGYPVYERVPNVSDLETRELRPDEREELRNVLNVVREREEVEKEFGSSTSIMGRRSFLKGIASLAAAGAVAKVGYKTSSEEEVVTESLRKKTSAESVEESNFSEKFEGELEGYEAYFTIDRNHIQFFNDGNRLVGEPVELESFVGPLPEGVKVKEGQKPEYNYAITKDENNIPKITKRWRKFKQAEIQLENPEQSIAGYRHSLADLRAAAKETDEPRLVEGIKSEEVNSYQDIVDYFVGKPIEGFGGDRIDYLRQYLKFRSESEAVENMPGVFREAVPQVVQEELFKVLPGLIAQESKFNEGLVNKDSGATGPGQFIPDTWKRYTGEDEVSADFVRQVEVMGPCISDIYDRVLNKIGSDAVDKFRSIFSDEHSFLVDLMVPLTINSYNAGPDRVAEAARLYAESVQVDDMKPGKDLFLAIADFGEMSQGGKYFDRYGEHAREYTTRVYANAGVLNRDRTRV